MNIKHYFSGGVYVKETIINAGQILVQHKHEYEHLSYLVSGTVAVQVDGVTSTMTGPTALTIEAGKHHGVKALTDTVWLCIHATDCTDADKVDEVLITDAEPGQMDQIIKDMQ